MKLFRVPFVSLLIAASTFGVGLPAQAAPGDSISLYFSAPFVTGSSVTNGGTTENFNSFSTGACPTTVTGFATLTFTPGECTVESQPGTSPGSSTPAVGVALSPYVSRTTNTTFTFPSGVKYVGFWWMMGSNGNNVEFLDSSDATIASFNVNDVISFLGASNLVTNSDTRTVTNVGGGTYPTRHFYRSPSAYTGTVADPVMNYNTMTYANEPWIYLNLFVSGEISVSKVRFTGSNFEMDNLTVTTTETGPTPDMVLVSNILGTAPTAQVVTWDPTNTSFTEPDTELTPNEDATSSGTGAITYEVVDAGTAGCTVNATTGVITRTAAGDCVVRAVAAAVTGSYYRAYKDVTFTFSEAPGGGNTPNPPTTTDSPSLADTGFDPMMPLGVALASLMVGAGALFVARRKSARI